MKHKTLCSNYFSFFILLFVFFSVEVMAQEDASTSSSVGLRYGVRIGATVSNFSNAQPHTSSKLGFTIGAVVEYGLSDKFSVQTEPAYMQQGGQYIRFTDDTRFGSDDIFAVSTTSSSVTAHYIDVPLLAKYKLPAIGNFNPNIVLGGACGILIKASDSFERTYHYTQTYFTVSSKQNVTSDFEMLQVGLTAGLGGEVSLGSKRLLIDVRYRYGLTDAKKSFSYISLYDVQNDLRTDSFYFTIGLGF
jgi:opacity protein-like surface antigen